MDKQKIKLKFGTIQNFRIAAELISDSKFREVRKNKQAIESLIECTPAPMPMSAHLIRYIAKNYDGNVAQFCLENRINKRKFAAELSKFELESFYFQDLINSIPNFYKKL